MDSTLGQNQKETKQTIKLFQIYVMKSILLRTSSMKASAPPPAPTLGSTIPSVLLMLVNVSPDTLPRQRHSSSVARQAHARYSAEWKHEEKSFFF